MNYTFIKTKLVFLNLFCALSFSVAQSNSLFEQLLASDLEEVEIHTDIVALLEQTPSETDYQDAQLKYVSSTGEEVNWELELKPRGKYRRRVCEFPPLKLNFSKKQLRERGLSEFDKLKLVTHCSDNRAASKEAVIREFLAYELYNVISPESFRVKLIEIKYIDTKQEVSGFSRYGFLIEGTAELAARLQAEECEDCFATTPTQIVAKSENIMATFQYMIGNTDFSVAQSRNMKLFRPSAGGQMIPVGYDFDFAGIVSPGYAIPAKHLGQNMLTDRVYLGYSTSDEVIESTLTLFESKREILIDVIRQEKRLSLSVRQEMKNYVQAFFVEINALKTGNSRRTYAQLRQAASKAVPDGGVPVHYGIGR